MKYRALLDSQSMQHLFNTWYLSEMFAHINIQMKGFIQDGKKMFDITISADYGEDIEMLAELFNRYGKVFGMDWKLDLQRQAD